MPKTLNPNNVNPAEVRLTRVPSIFTDPKSGRVLATNKRKLYETPFFLQTNPPNNKVAITALATTDQQTMRISAEGPLQVSAFGATRAAECTVMIYLNDGATPVRLMNSPIHIDTIFGNGGQMYPLPQGLYLDENRALSLTYTDLSNGSNSAQVAFNAAKYSQLQQDANLARVKQRLQMSQYLSMPFWYTFDQGPVTLTALQQQQIEIQIDPAFHFEIHQLSFKSTGTFSINIVDLAKGESIINAPSNTNYAIPHLLLCGNNQYPYKYSEPVMVFAQQKLLVTLQDTSNASNTVWLTLGGKAIATKQWSS